MPRYSVKVPVQCIVSFAFEAKDRADALAALDDWPAAWPGIKCHSHELIAFMPDWKEKAVVKREKVDPRFPFIVEYIEEEA